MTQPTRHDAYLAALLKTAGRKFDGAGQPILTSMEKTALRVARAMDVWDEADRHKATLAELERLDGLDRTVA